MILKSEGVKFEMQSPHNKINACIEQNIKYVLWTGNHL